MAGRNAPPEQTLAVFMPDLVVGGKLDEALALTEEEGFVILHQDFLVIDYSTAREFYKEHEGKAFFEDLLDYLCSGPAVVAVLARRRTVAEWLEFVGPTNPDKARAHAPDSLRARFGSDGLRNGVHGSEDAEAAKREIKLFFPRALVDEGDVAAELARVVAAGRQAGLMPLLSAGLAALGAERPADPVFFLGNWLMARKDLLAPEPAAEPAFVTAALDLGPVSARRAVSAVSAVSGFQS